MREERRDNNGESTAEKEREERRDGKERGFNGGIQRKRENTIER